MNMITVLRGKRSIREIGKLEWFSAAMGLEAFVALAKRKLSMGEIRDILRQHRNRANAPFGRRIVDRLLYFSGELYR